MLKMIKNGVKRLFRALGYDMRRITGPQDARLDLELYHNIFPKESIANKRFYNIGGGSFRHPFWINIDLKCEWYQQALEGSDYINFDLLSLEKMPIPDETAEIVYSSHTLEHINDQAAQNMFNESHRVLKKGGIFRLTSPDIDLVYRAYRDDDRNFFFWIDAFSIPENYEKIRIKIPMNKASTPQIFLYFFASQVSELHADSPVPKISDKELDRLFTTLGYEEALNYCTSKCSLEAHRACPGNHINWWNRKKALRMLKGAGFEDTHSSGYGQSYCPILRNTTLFDNTYPKASFYLEAVKR